MDEKEILEQQKTNEPESSDGSGYQEYINTINQQITKYIQQQGKI